MNALQVTTPGGLPGYPFRFKIHPDSPDMGSIIKNVKLIL
jgi:hypothetical protein